VATDRAGNLLAWMVLKAIPVTSLTVALRCRLNRRGCHRPLSFSGFAGTRRLAHFDG